MTSYLRIADPFGVELARLSGFTGGESGAVTYVMSVGQIGSLAATLPVDFDRSLLPLDGRVSAWRDLGSARPPYRDGNAEYFIRYWDDGPFQTSIACPHVNDLLVRRILNYFAGTAYTSKTSTPADDLIKEFASQQLGSGIVTADRQGNETRADISRYLAIQTDLSLGATTAKAAAWRNLFDVIREICDDSTEAGTYLTAHIVALGVSDLELSTFTDQYGVDRRASTGNDLIFSLERGNLANAHLITDRKEEVTFATAGGMGESTERVIQTASDDTRLQESIFNRREAFVELTNSADTAQLLAIAQARVRAGRPKIYLTGEIADTDGCIRGIHYDLGDYVTVEHRGMKYDTRLDQITVTWDERGEHSQAQFRVNVV